MRLLTEQFRDIIISISRVKRHLQTLLQLSLHGQVLSEREERWIRIRL